MKKITAVRGVAGKIAEGFLAGLLISLGGAVFLACILPDQPYAKYIGALLFSMALLVICMRGYALYTGKIGLLYEAHKKEDTSLLLLCLLGNVLATAAFGYLIGWVFPNLKETALSLCNGKLGQGFGFGLLRAVLCGILVYLSVDIYRNNGKNVIGIVFCIPAFILSGYEHSIADMFYFACAGVATWQSFVYILMILIGNSVGGLLIPTLRLIAPKKKADAVPLAETPAPADTATPAAAAPVSAETPADTAEDGGKPATEAKGATETNEDATTDDKSATETDEGATETEKREEK